MLFMHKNTHLTG